MYFMSKEQNKPIIQKCEKCGKENETVHANFLLYGFMVCESCKISESLDSNTLHDRIITYRGAFSE